MRVVLRPRPQTDIVRVRPTPDPLPHASLRRPRIHERTGPLLGLHISRTIQRSPVRTEPGFGRHAPVRQPIPDPKPRSVLLHPRHSAPLFRRNMTGPDQPCGARHYARSVHPREQAHMWSHPPIGLTRSTVIPRLATVSRLCSSGGAGAVRHDRLEIRAREPQVFAHETARHATLRGPAP